MVVFGVCRGDAEAEPSGAERQAGRGVSGLRILVTGSRSWTDRDVITRALLDALCLSTIGTPTLIHGMARGADKIADAVWQSIGRNVPGGLNLERCPADWEKNGRAAGYIRNAEMVRSGADICLAFPLGASPGTRNCMRLAAEAGIRVVNYGDEEQS
jgi:hypothetical protein